MHTQIHAHTKKEFMSERMITAKIDIGKKVGVSKRERVGEKETVKEFV